MTHLVKSFGNECCFSPTDQFEKTVSVSYDSVEYDPNAEVKVFVHNEHSVISPHLIPSVLNNYESFDLILSWNDEFKHLPNFQKFIFGDCWIDFDTFEGLNHDKIGLLFEAWHKNRCIKNNHHFYIMKESKKRERKIILYCVNCNIEEGFPYNS